MSRQTVGSTSELLIGQSLLAEYNRRCLRRCTTCWSKASTIVLQDKGFECVSGASRESMGDDRAVFNENFETRRLPEKHQGLTLSVLEHAYEGFDSSVTKSRPLFNNNADFSP